MNYTQGWLWRCTELDTELYRRGDYGEVESWIMMITNQTAANSCVHVIDVVWKRLRILGGH